MDALGHDAQHSNRGQCEPSSLYTGVEIRYRDETDGSPEDWGDLTQVQPSKDGAEPERSCLSPETRPEPGGTGL